MDHAELARASAATFITTFASRSPLPVSYPPPALICPDCGAKNLPHAEVCASCDADLTVDADAFEVDPLIGRVLGGKYELGDIIGEGSMGCVYAAHQTDLDREVAIKVLHAHVAADPKVAKRFHREARTASRLSHPNSLQVFDFGKEDDGKLLYLAMELLDGPDLLDVITDESPLTPRRIGHLVDGVLLALEEAHDMGVIHRDLKPENIMVVTDHQGREHVKVCDFGIAKLVEAEGSAITVTGFVCGTPEYMAPEQARGEALDGRADLYAIGCLLYQLICASPPFSGKSALGTITQHLTDRVERPRDRRPDLNVPRAMERVVLRALAKDRERRFDDAAAMRRALADAVASLGELADDPLGTHEDQTRSLTGAPASGRRWLAPALTLLGTALVVVASIWAIRRGDARPQDPPVDAGALVLADAGAPAADTGVATDAGTDALEPDAGAEPAEPDTGVLDTGPRRRRDAGTRGTMIPTMDPSSMESGSMESGMDTEPRDEGRAHFEEGRRRFLASDVRGAIAAFERARRAMPRNPQVHKELGRAYMRAGDAARGRRAYERYLELAPDAPDRALVEQILGRP